jgi:hypothetical protein
MSEASIYAPCVLELDEDNIVTGGWVRQMQLNNAALRRYALDIHEREDIVSTAYIDLARWTAGEDAYEYYVHAAADAILCHPDLDSRPSLMAGFKHETRPVPGGIQETEFVIRLLRGIKIRETIARQGILRRPVVTSEITTHYGLAVVGSGEDGVPKAVVHDSADMPLLSFARKLEPLLYFAQPRLWHDTVFVDDREIMKVAPTK